MADLTTTYLGLELKNPFIAGASGLTGKLDKVKKLEDTGAAAVVTPSLFEEQIQLESFVFQEEMHRFDNLNAEMTTLFPDLEHSGPEEHLLSVQKTVQAVDPSSENPNLMTIGPEDTKYFTDRRI